MTVPDHSVPPRPASDVSSAVGLVGVLGLCLWVLFCHFYPDFAPLLGLDPTRGRLTGPNAALTGLLASAVPMVLWSVLVDKVHRNPSTGIDWDSPPRKLREIADVSIAKIAGLWVDQSKQQSANVTTVFSATPLTADEWSQQHSPETLQ